MNKRYSVREVAEIYGYSPGYIREKLEKGFIRGEKLGKFGHWRVSEQELIRVFGSKPDPRPRATKINGKEMQRLILETLKDENFMRELRSGNRTG